MTFLDLVTHCPVGQAVHVFDHDCAENEFSLRAQELLKEKWSFVAHKRVHSVYATSIDHDGRVEGVLNVTLKS
ncbi:hypothetical protein [Microvirus mar18]|uniref:Uncharacterized protein n=1 Tax=Microvirus mar18 TaxID=2851150 RepID=A0A8F5MKY9_9VIRU|nr:hypothetical protein [Microvirus mar18]